MTGEAPVGTPIQRGSASRGAIDRARAIEEGYRANRHRARGDEAPEARASHWAPRRGKTADAKCETAWKLARAARRSVEFLVSCVTPAKVDLFRNHLDARGHWSTRGV